MSSKASGKKSSSTPAASTKSKETGLDIHLDQEKENEVDQHVPVKMPRGEKAKGDDPHPDSVFGPFSSGANRLNSPMTRSSRSDRSKPISVTEVYKDRDSFLGGGPFSSSQHPAINLAAPTHGVASIDLVPPTSSCSYTVEVLSGPYAGQVLPLGTLLKRRISATRGWELHFGRAEHCDCSLPLDIYLSEM